MIHNLLPRGKRRGKMGQNKTTTKKRERISPYCAYERAGKTVLLNPYEFSRILLYYPDDRVHH